MKNFKELKAEQAQLCASLRKKVLSLLPRVEAEKNISAFLLTGSVARGDARLGPFGLYVDLLVIHRDCKELDLRGLFGEDMEPEIPHYCVEIDGTGFQIQVSSESAFLTLPKSEDQSFALAESELLYCCDQRIEEFFTKQFKSPQAPRRSLAMENYHSFQYFTNPYRMEKWLYREAYPQVSENLHQSLLRLCHFIYAINGSFIPRNDWIVYLLHDQEIISEELEQIMEAFLKGAWCKDDIASVETAIQRANDWMKSEIERLGW